MPCLVREYGWNGEVCQHVARRAPQQALDDAWPAPGTHHQQLGAHCLRIEQERFADRSETPMASAAAAKKSTELFTLKAAAQQRHFQAGRRSPLRKALTFTPYPVDGADNG